MNSIDNIYNIDNIDNVKNIDNEENIDNVENIDSIENIDNLDHSYQIRLVQDFGSCFRSKSNQGQSNTILHFLVGFTPFLPKNA